MFSKKYIEELMSVAGENYPVLHNAGTHKRPVTRREMLGQGLILGGTFVAVPSILELVFDYLGQGKAYGVEAAQCVPAAAGAAPPAFLQIEATGGNMMAGDFVFGKQAAGGAIEFLSTAGYTTIGWDATAHPTALAPNMAFGAPFHARSPLLAGLLATMSPAAVAKTGVAGMANASQDDTANNPFGSTNLAIKGAGSRGALVQIAGSNATPNGGRTAINPLGQDAALSRALIQSTASLQALVNPGVLGTLLGNGDPATGLVGADKVAKAAMAMSEKKLAMFNSMQLNAQLQTLVACGYMGSSDLITKFTFPTLDPTNDPLFTGATTPALTGQVPAPLFNQTSVLYNGVATALGGSLTAAQQSRTASIVKLLVKDNAAAGAIEMGGYDYHQQGLATTNGKQLALGVTIGQALEAAHRNGKDMFVVVTTDGATSAGGTAVNGQTAPAADSGARGCSIMFAIGKTARPAMNHNQIGTFNDSGAVVATDGLQANSPANASTVIAANFAQFAGKGDNFGKVVAASGGVNPVTSDPKKYLAFK